MNLVDKFLDRLTMYKLLIYYLAAILTVAAILGVTHTMQYNALGIIFSASYCVLICWISNKVFATVFEAPTGAESSIITGLILSLIINPFQNPHDILFLTAASGLAVASKYILAIRNKHIFNPAAAAVTLTAVGAGQAASWWVGNQYLLPVVLFGGVLIGRKLERGPMLLVFFVAASISVGGLGLLHHHGLLATLKSTYLHSSLLFMGFVMLTEPATSPTNRQNRLLYAGLAGLLFSPLFHFVGVYSTPERDLFVSNIFAYIVSPKEKLRIFFKERLQASRDVIDFVFSSRSFAYQPGQFMEWTLPHTGVDSRGSRRYFTLASSPTEPDLRIGMKFSPESSSFKQALLSLNRASPVAAGQLGGDFIMSADKNQKLAFIAGGIGVTPFRSMIKYLIDQKENRDLAMIYSENEADNFAYTDVFNQAVKQLGSRIVYTVTGQAPANWRGQVGQISAAMIKKEIPDFVERTFYLSGPQPMVASAKQTLKALGIPKTQIKADFFPGYA